ncbi:DEAD/DEAH box helicase [Colletotrichum melonis]|uniref:RNA helicase n=4 Tax=Colletotrichum acutatum species complex TaxID=2707335 RepID=A0AAI9Z0R4_9PEZI|nr:DEAD/DEAH box helicase [Colletotrichum costaricense]XP_060388429.1 DEAD/DEAH box helicase [Colletotrichum tamarilloi]KAK1468833.1 DEAD/DEAH box helicase [Colletotrichum melonis]KAK1486849.1 DEAD/DEAH box helicase [Colletotrichum cuscutae]KAK1511993.1 DEAD/DEAH box helicase [Colletotrichum tamarilloi]KAK1530510.1 DEAD/DEAH box helicase [Colletotrichum costaricense]
MADLASRITEPPAEGAAPEATQAVQEAQEAEVPQADGAADSGLIENTYDVDVKLGDLQSDQNSTLYSVSTFSEMNLRDEILRGLLSLNYQKPSKIQEKALPLMLTDPPRNMIAQSQSGTGKTAAFVVTTLSRVDFSQLEQPQALMLAPSRELARQIEGVVRNIGKFCEGLNVAAALPGALERNAPVRANVIVGTPGTVMDIIRRRQLDVSKLRLLVIDEADNMLDQQGLGEQCLRVKNMLPRDIQILLFSATFPDKVMGFAEKFAPKADQIRLKHTELTVKGISQMYIDCPTEQDKYEVLVKLYGLMTIGSSVIFVKTRESADEIKRRMEADGHRVSALHGAKDGPERDRLLEEFRTGQSKVLLTTNVLARGIDVSSVSMVINYDIPMKGRGDSEPDPETYLHRIGRTGRFGRIGVSISFVYDKKSFYALKNIADLYEIDLVQLDANDWDQTEEDVQKVIKSNRAKAAFAPSATDASVKS